MTNKVIIPGVTHIVLKSLGDGSCWPYFFSSEKKANAFAKSLQERFCDDVIDITDGIEVDR